VDFLGITFVCFATVSCSIICNNSVTCYCWEEIMERKLAKIVIVDAINSIENADAIEVAKIGGWNVVVKKGEFLPLQKAVYFEIDSWIPEHIAPFLFEGKEFNGVNGARLRTKKLRGVISQGLLIPLPELYTSLEEGTDVTELFGVQKWEKPLPEQLRGMAKGNFPSFIPKTDQERIQNLTREIVEYADELFEVSIKLDGSSITVFVYNGENGVCSRNIELKEDDSNAFWKIAKELDLHSKIKKTGRNLALQGEMLAPNIQSNYEKVDKLCMFVYDVYDIDRGCYLLPDERQKLCDDLEIKQVPIIGYINLVAYTDDILAMAEGEGMNAGVKREGLVFKHMDSDFSFKAISNSYLLKNNG